jgi:UDP-N-acetyl-D-glucosamine/UDP-N-acetyl-D-galactosamine dehydrogenase
MIKENEISIAVIGLGYVGFPLAVELSKLYQVCGFDLNIERIDELKKGIDRTNEINSSNFKNLDNIHYTSDIESIKSANIYIVTVPTPVDKNKIPDLSPLKNASKAVGRIISRGNIVIYESTVYPGATEEVCVPILEKKSKLKYNIDFFCGYSPERINPGDKKYTLTSIKKITSGSNFETAEFIKNLYKTIIKAGVFPASSIAVAEAAKVIENTQRDVNIALINELALIFNKLGLDTNEVLEAAGTKWNFLPFKPGLVGGHCIGVDPYYLTHKAVEIGYTPEVILAGRRINDSMGKFIAEQTILKLVENNVDPSKAKVGILGLAFKENCPDLRNTKVITIIENLKKYKCEIYVSDEYANKDDALSQYGISLCEINQINRFDSIIVAVAHDKYTVLEISDWKKLLNPNGVIMDVKSVYELGKFSKTNFNHWRL